MQLVERLAIFERLRHSIQLLACQSEIQVGLLPDFVCKADELALDFDHWKDVVLSNFGADLTADQKSCIENIDRRLSALTHLGPEHWTEHAVRESQEWQRLRSVAIEALQSFGWPQQTPPSHADEYIGGTQ